MLLGVVSNCWRVQLTDGVELDSLIGEAYRRGLRAIELRQTCLGRYESGDNHLPNAKFMVELPRRFTGIRFNVAVSVPFMDPAMPTDDPVFTAGKWAAQAVAGQYAPHLRLVDSQTVGSRIQEIMPHDAAQTVARLAQSLAELDGTLSVENSAQPWLWFREVFDSARKQLGAEASRLRLCFDPCNLLLVQDGSDPVQVMASLLPDEVSMIHFKQRLHNHIVPAITDGDIEWKKLVEVMNERRFAVPGLFEVDPHKRVWDYLAGSREYLRRLGLETEVSVFDREI